ncbi:hypothetical protein EYF80_051222 [Liparis tanakae]|uniref:Uncharacterized protein n=1 Tax=Liparis tanakae TaxID=230148 RepID=A0A4Z2FCE5_9TELE|nr:hypothetical protein EYF80_051222 [Liparis tanakae]
MSDHVGSAHLKRLLSSGVNEAQSPSTKKWNRRRLKSALTSSFLVPTPDFAVGQKSCCSLEQEPSRLEVK